MNILLPKGSNFDNHRSRKILAFTENLATTGVKKPTVLIWQEKHKTAALGISQKAEEELNLAAIEKDNLRIVRRQSGGGAVILTAETLCFEVIAPLTAGFAQETIKESFIKYTLPLVNLFKSYNIATKVSGISDISINFCQQWKKAVGCAQLRKKNALVVHASILINLDKSLMERYLKWPSAVPDYREGRSHTDFCINLAEIIPEITPQKLAKELKDEFIASGWKVLPELPEFTEQQKKLLIEKYRNSGWNLSRKRPRIF